MPLHTDFSHIQCVLNLDNYVYIPQQMDFILRTLPMRAIFQQFGTLFFHCGADCCKGNRYFVYCSVRHRKNNAGEAVGKIPRSTAYMCRPHAGAAAAGRLADIRLSAGRVRTNLQRGRARARCSGAAPAGTAKSSYPAQRQTCHCGIDAADGY